LESQNEPESGATAVNGGVSQVSAEDRLPGIRAMSIWALLAWSILTLGFYPYFWLGLRAKHFNQLRSTAKVSVAAIVFSAVAGVVTPFFMEPPPDVPGIGGYVICAAAWIIFVVSLSVFYLQFFHARRAMMDHLAAYDTPEADLSGISALWTFLFVYFYLQFRINWAVTEDETDTAR